MAHGMEFRRRVAALDEALPHPGDHAVVLGMDADERPVLARRDEHVEQRLVVDLEAVVGHEHLDRGVPGADQRRQMLPDGRLGRVGDDHVEGIVDDRALAGEAGIVLDDLRQVHADVLGRERDHRRGAAMRGRDRRALPGIGVHHPGGRELLDVAMRVDAARQHQLAARIDLATARREAAADRGDALAGDREVGLEGIARGRERAAADDEVVGGFGHNITPRGFGPITPAPPMDPGSSLRCGRDDSTGQEHWTTPAPAFQWVGSRETPCPASSSSTRTRTRP